MQDDERELRQINVEMATMENAGDRAWFDGVLASRLAFQRADPDRTVDDRVAFLQKVKSEDPPKDRQTDPESVEVRLYGSRAVVSCIVTMTDKGELKAFHNLRLFIKEGGQWKLLGWANE
jgi:Domain of unknown function (DUF4440)